MRRARESSKFLALECTVYLLGLVALFPAKSWSSGGLAKSGSESHLFAPGGVVKITVPVGEIVVRPDTSGQILLRYKVRPRNELFRRSGRELSRMRLEFSIQRSVATIRFIHRGRRTHIKIHVEVDVPSPETVRAHVGVGTIDIAGVAGDKNLNAGVGQIRVAIGMKPQYFSIVATAGIGSIYGWPSTSAGRSLSVLQCGGLYRLVAQTGVGDIKFSQ